VLTMSPLTGVRTREQIDGLVQRIQV
jgi:hypothetical protein